MTNSRQGQRDIEAILLAAGSSRRFGGVKLVASWRGGVLLDGALDCALASPAGRVTIVTGANSDAIERAAHLRHPLAEIGVVHADRHASGMGHSLAAGMASIQAGCQILLIFLADMPLVPHKVAHGLCAQVRQGAAAAAPFFQGRRGHPVAFAASEFDVLRALKGDQGAGAHLAALGDRVAALNVDDPGILIDVDLPADLPD